MKRVYTYDQISNVYCTLEEEQLDLHDDRLASS